MNYIKLIALILFAIPVIAVDLAFTPVRLIVYATDAPCRKLGWWIAVTFVKLAHPIKEED